MLMKKFFEINSQPNVSNENQLWSYKILSVGNLILKTAADSSPRMQGILGSYSDGASQIIRGEVKFDVYRANMISLSEEADSYFAEQKEAKLAFFDANDAGVKDFSDCVLVTAMHNTSQVKK